MRRFAASLGCAIVAAVGFATPASAEEFGGTYELELGGETATWTVVPCGGEPFIPCVHVAQSGGDMAPWLADAKLSVGYWTVHVERPDTIVCDDGEKFPARTTYSWDAITLDGWIGAQDPGVCGDEGGSLAAPFTLVKVGPAGMAPAEVPPAEAPVAEIGPAEGPAAEPVPPPALPAEA